MIQVSITWTHLGSKAPRAPTIWEALAAKLGREPSDAEAADEVRRILREASEERMVAQAGAGKLPWQRRR